VGKLLFDESPLVVQPTMAKAIGLNEAIVLQQIHYWLRNGKSGKEIEGVRWIWNSLSDWQVQFPFWSESTIYRTLQSLEEKKLIKTGCFNQRKGDRTKWFTIAYDLLEAIEKGGDETPSSHNETSSSQDGTTLPETSSEISSPLSKGGEPKAKEPEKTPKQEALESLEKVFFQYGGTMNPALIERFYAVFEGNPDNPKERFAHALKRLEETRSFFKAIDAYREWALPKPQSSYQRPKPGIGRAGPPTGYTPPSAEERAAFQASLARAGGT
jgi:hypothetical protein